MNYNDWEDIKKMILEREKYLLVGPNVIHLQFSEGLLSERIVEEFENKLCQVGLELSRCKFMVRNSVYSNLNKPQPKTFILVAQPLIGEQIMGKAANEKWKTIKNLMFTIWKNLNKDESSFDLIINLDRNTSLSFIIHRDFNDKSIQDTLDKIIFFIGEQRPNEKYKLVEYVYFDAKEDKWLKTDVQNNLYNY